MGCLPQPSESLEYSYSAQPSVSVGFAPKAKLPRNGLVFSITWIVGLNFPTAKLQAANGHQIHCFPHGDVTVYRGRRTPCSRRGQAAFKLPS